MSVFVKICGLSTAESVVAAVSFGADALGFVFAESPRRVTPAQARELTAGLPAGIVTVAVMKHPSQAEVDEVLDVFRPTWLQTDAEDFSALSLVADLQPLPVFRDTPALDTADVAARPRALFEAAVSGAGQRADWGRAAELAGRTELMLAGGLDPDNVAAAVRQVKPWAVDVSSGVEHQRGCKDRDKIAAFIRAARQVL